MLALRFTQTKNFMERLLLSPAFDRFLLSEASITTAATISIDGHFHPDFYPEADAEENAPVRADRGLVYWEQLRPTCFQLIRGKHTPLAFSFIFCLASSNIQKLLADAALSFRPEDVRALFLNIRYDNGSLTCTTATSMNLFTLDKSLEEVWEKAVTAFFLRLELSFETL